MRRFLLFLILGILLAFALSGCASKPSLAAGKLNVVTSFYPLYDFAAKIGGDRVHVINLVPVGVEPHDWTPKSGDIRTINAAQLFVYQGGGFEGWIDDYLQTVPAGDRGKIVEAGKGIQLFKNSEGTDPHLWLSPPNAKRMAEAIRDGLDAVDSANKAEYDANYQTLAARLDDLDSHYREALAPTTRKQIVVSHEAFGYLCREYGLTQLSIMGLAPDAEPTARQMKTVVDFIRASGVRYVFYEELVSDSLAKTIASAAGVGTMTLNPMEGLSEKDQKAGKDYFSIMNANLQNLVKALQ